jgi:hypothetical protein
MVLVTALIRDLSKRFGSAVDVLTTGSWSEPLLRGQSGVGEIISVRSRKSPYWLSRSQWHGTPAADARVRTRVVLRWGCRRPLDVGARADH